MNVFALLLLLGCVTSILALPRKWVPVPLLTACCYMTTGQGLELGPMSLPIFRLVLAAALLRIALRRESVAGGSNTIDVMMVILTAWMMFASLFHEWRSGAGPVYTAGFMFNVVAVYVLVRVSCRDMSDVERFVRILAFVLVPVALAMVAEHVYQRNFFGIFGGVTEAVYMRDGRIRAQGPFAHPILAGTVGAVCFPLMIGLWRSSRLIAVMGMTASLAMVIASTSSGPLMSFGLGIAALATYQFRRRLWLLRWAVLALYVAAELVMTRPAYYLISKFDLTGSSTGWHRARLIEVSLQHLPEWIAFGTDYTGHWMPYTLDAAGQQSDITNYYLFFGITGGLLAALLLVAILWRAFVYVGKVVDDVPSMLPRNRFLIWSLGAGLFSHAVTSLSVAYFDQSVIFFWINVGVIASMYSARATLHVGASQGDATLTADDGVRGSGFRRERQRSQGRRLVVARRAGIRAR